MKSMKSITLPISRTCECLIQVSPFKACGKPTAWAYRATGVGWMALCEECAKPHIDISEPIQTLLAKGERLTK